MSQTKPTSSLNAAKIKSDCASGIYPNFCNHFPYQFPKNQPHPIAARACSFCHQIDWLESSSHHQIKYEILCCKYANFVLTDAAMLPNTNTHPAPIHKVSNIFFRFNHEYIHITNTLAHTTNALPKSGMKQNIARKIAFITRNEINN